MSVIVQEWAGWREHRAGRQEDQHGPGRCDLGLTWGEGRGKVEFASSQWSSFMKTWKDLRWGWEWRWELDGEWR